MLHTHHPILPPPPRPGGQSVIRETKAYYLSNNTSAEGQKRLNNILMQLRKAANHPLLFRRHYTDERLVVLAKRLQREVDYCEARLVDIQRELERMSDFELHSLCRTYPSVAEHALAEEAWMDSGKVRKLQELLPAMVANGGWCLAICVWVVVALPGSSMLTLPPSDTPAPPTTTTTTTRAQAIASSSLASSW
jgi:hypothetical protein